MDKKYLLSFGLFVFMGLLVWGPAVSFLTKLLLPDATTLQIYLINKGSFALVLLAFMSRTGGLSYFGMKPGSNWWSLIPGLPFILLTLAVFFSPEAAFGLSMPATIGWILVAIFVGLGEECLFRGILWRAVEPHGKFVTVLLTSSLFGAAHLMGLFADLPWQIVVSQAVFAFGVGIMFAAVRLVSHSLFAPILLHAVFDAAAIVSAGGISEMFNESLSVEKLLIPGAIFAVWGLGCTLIAMKIRSKRHPESLAEHPSAGAKPVG